MFFVERGRSFSTKHSHCNSDLLLDGVNGSKLLEAYCTSFVTKAKLRGTSIGGKPGASVNKALKVAERWREEWDRGVQMPIDDVKRALHKFETSGVGGSGDGEPCKLYVSTVLR